MNAPRPVRTPFYAYDRGLITQRVALGSGTRPRVVPAMLARIEPGEAR